MKRSRASFFFFRKRLRFERGFAGDGAASAERLFWRKKNLEDELFLISKMLAEEKCLLQISLWQTLSARSYKFRSVCYTPADSAGSVDGRHIRRSSGSAELFLTVKESAFWHRRKLYSRKSLHFSALCDLVDLVRHVYNLQFKWSCLNVIAPIENR